MKVIKITITIIGILTLTISLPVSWPAIVGILAAGVFVVAVCYGAAHVLKHHSSRASLPNKK